MISELLRGMGSGAGGLLVLLLAGHVFGDFLFQNEWMAREKETRVGPLLIHGLVMFAAHVGVLAPFITGRLLTGLVALSVVHVGLDAWRSRGMGRWGASLGAFLLDQALHVAALLLLWVMLRSPDGFQTVRWFHSSQWVAWYARWLAVGAAYVFVVPGGSRIVRGLLERSGFDKPPADNSFAMGEHIGHVERLLVLTLVLFGQWAAIGLIVAAKSIVRFRDGSTSFAEYYLLGTLTSMLVAIGAGVLVKLLFP